MEEIVSSNSKIEEIQQLFLEIVQWATEMKKVLAGLEALKSDHA